jgi:tetratricopeptide (TPR) repeat protein
MERRAGFAFNHLLTQQAAYGALLGSNRRALHSAAADALAARIVPGAPDEASLLARLVAHLEAAQRWPEAFGRCCTLLNRLDALGRFDNWDGTLGYAAALWRRARAADPALPEESSELVNARASGCAHTGRLDEARALAQRALELARQQGHRAAEARAINNLGIAAHFGGLHADAFRYYSAALAAYRALDDATGCAQLCNNLGVARFEVDDAAGALEILREGLELVTRAGLVQLVGNLELNNGLALSALGDDAAARAHLTRGLQAARRQGNLGEEGLTLGYLGEVEERAGHPATARDYYTSAERLARLTGSARFSAWWLDHLCALDLAAGDRAAARARAAAALAQARRSGGRTVESYALCQLAEVELAEGDSAAARRWLDQAQALVPPTTGRLWRLSAKLEDLQQRLDSGAGTGGG